MTSFGKIVKDRYGLALLTLAVAGTALCRSRVPSNSMFALRWPTNAPLTIPQANTLSSTVFQKPSIAVTNASVMGGLYDRNTIDYINATAAGLSMVAAQYREGDSPQIVMKSFFDRGLSNRLEQIYSCYTNLLMSGTLSQEETNHVIVVLQQRANVAILYVNPQTQEILLSPHIAMSSNGGITTISNASEVLFKGSLWLDTQSREKGRP